MPEFIYVMKTCARSSRRTEIPQGIWLSFFFGREIGVLGANAPGKLAPQDHGGLDPQFNGEAFAAKDQGRDAASRSRSSTR